MSVEIPADFYERPDLLEVVTFLVGQVATGKDKVRALRRWSDWTDTLVGGELYGQVERSGIDKPAAIKLPGEG